MSKKFSRLFSLLIGTLKIGFLGFGGGNALIPIIEEELVKKESW